MNEQLNRKWWFDEKHPENRRNYLLTERGRFNAHIQQVNYDEPRPKSLSGWLKYLWAQDNVQILVVVVYLLVVCCVIGR